MKLSQLRPRANERMMIAGTTGSGKTTLARELVRPYPSLLVIDPKCTYGGREGEPGFRLARNPRQLRQLSSKVKRVQYRPDVEYQNVRGYDLVYEWAFRRGELMVYTDEAFQVHHGSHAPDYLRHCLTSGRELGIGMILSTQRPRGIDLRVMTEAELLVTFELRHRDDRRRMSEFMGEEVMAPLPEYAFWFWRTGMARPRANRLELSGRGSGPNAR